jgi:hypothetical protein
MVDDTNGNGSKRLGITVFSGGMCGLRNRCPAYVGHHDERAVTDVLLPSGTAANSLVDVFNKIVQKRRCQLNYVIPISDNGGSSSELIRFVGGPSKWMRVGLW